MQTVACVFIVRLHSELGFITEKYRLNSDAAARLLLDVTMLVMVGGAVALRVLRWIGNGCIWIRE